MKARNMELVHKKQNNKNSRMIDTTNITITLAFTSLINLSAS